MYKKILASVVGLILGASTAVMYQGQAPETPQLFGTSTFTVQQGGTGKNTLSSSEVLYGNGTGPVGTVATGTVTCTGSASCGAGSYVLGNSLVINATGGSGGVGNWFTPVPTYGSILANATTTLVGFTNGLYTNASSTFVGGFTADRSTTTQATSSVFFATIASTTNLFARFANFNFSTTTYATTTSAFATTASSTNLFARFANFNFATTTYATTTSSFATTASSTNLFTSFASFATTTGQLWPGTAFTFGSTTVFGKTQFGGTIASSTSNCSGAIVVNFATGNSQKIIATGACSISFATSTMVDGFAYKLKVCQDPTGNRAVTFGNPGQMVFSGGSGATTSPNLTANASTWMGMIYDGTTQRLDVVASSTKLNAADPRSCQP